MKNGIGRPPAFYPSLYVTNARRRGKNVLSYGYDDPQGIPFPPHLKNILVNQDARNALRFKSSQPYNDMDLHKKPIRFSKPGGDLHPKDFVSPRGTGETAAFRGANPIFDL